MEYVRIIWDSLVNCFNCHDNQHNPHEPNERSHLLIDPVSHSQQVQQSVCEDFTREYPSSLPKREEQNALSRIVQETATNIIDVAAMDAHNIEAQEYSTRVKTYSHKLSQQWSKVQQSTGPKGLLQDLPNPEQILSEPTASSSDLQMMRCLVQKAALAVNDIKVDHTEDLIVPFRIP